MFPRVIVRMFKFTFGRHEVIGTVVVFEVYFMLHKFVETDMPNKLATSIEPTSIS